MSPIASKPCTSGGPTAADTAIADQLRPRMNGPRMGQSINAGNICCARVIVSTTKNRGLRSRAAVIAVTTAITESTLHNYIEAVDHDSLGLFQQRPSQGWGTPAQVTDPVYATNKFLSVMLDKYPNNRWMRGDIGAICQRVQVSAFPDAYAHEVHDARLIVNALWTDAPAPREKRIDVVALGGGNQLYQKFYIRDKGWSDWGNLGAPTGGLTSDPAICSWEPRRWDIFARGANNQLVHKWFNKSKWSDWEDLGGILASGPAAVAWEPERIDVVVRGGGNQLYQKYYRRDGGWSDWVNLGAPTGGLTSDPAICSWEPRRLDIFARGANNQLVHKWFASEQWFDWEDLGGILASGPAVVAWGPGRIDVVALGGGNQLYQKYFRSGVGWSEWVNLGAPTGGLTSDPAICSWEPRRLDIFARGANNQLVHKWFNGSEWSDWEDLGGILSSGPDAICPPP